MNKNAVKIFKAIEPKIIELGRKLIKGNCNRAIIYAYEIGFICDIENQLKDILKEEKLKWRIKEQIKKTETAIKL